jgi:hypothetical protein
MLEEDHALENTKVLLERDFNVLNEFVIRKLCVCRKPSIWSRKKRERRGVLPLSMIYDFMSPDHLNGKSPLWDHGDLRYIFWAQAESLRGIGASRTLLI